MRPINPNRISIVAIAICTLVLLGFAWAGRLIVRHPTAGATWSLTTGIVDQVKPAGPAFGRLQVGDRILSIDGMTALEARSYPGKLAGDQLHMQISRGSQTIPVTIVLASASLRETAERLAPMAIAFSFWLMGMFILAFAILGGEELAVFIFSQAVCTVLITGSASPFGYEAVRQLFACLLIWVGPVAIHTHQYFPVRVGQRQPPRFVYAPYAVALVLTGIYLLRPAILPGLSDATFQGIRYLWLGLCLAIWATSLVMAYRRSRSAETRQKIGIVCIFCIVSISPFVFLSLLPDAVFQVTVLPYTFSFFFLIGLPGGYGYAILRYRLIAFERYINRSVVYALLAIVVGTVFTTSYLWIQKIFPSMQGQLQTSGVIILMILTIFVHPLYTILQRWVDAILYGGWTDNTQAIQRIGQSLDEVEGDERSIALTLCQAIQGTLQLDYANLVARDGSVFSSDPAAATQLTAADHEAIRQFIAHLENQGELAIGRILELSDFQALSVSQRKAVLGKRADLWVQLSSNQRFLALLILGHRRGGGALPYKDMDILDVIARQAKIALENAYLLQEVQQQSHQTAQVSRQVIRAREEERKRLARDLHDKIIQSLVGLNYHLAGTGQQAPVEMRADLAETQKEVKTIMGDVRQICSDLRPPALDTLGLIPAIHSRIEELKKTATIPIQLQIQGVEDGAIPEEIALCLFRIFQEATINVVKHAAATRIDVKLQTEDGLLELAVWDNGRGFQMPAVMGTLAQGHHFGLLGAQEMLDGIGGSLEIISAPGEGCQVVARVPLPGKNGQEENAGPYQTRGNL